MEAALMNVVLFFIMLALLIASMVSFFIAKKNSDSLIKLRYQSFTKYMEELSAHPYKTIRNIVNIIKSRDSLDTDLNLKRAKAKKFGFVSLLFFLSAFAIAVLNGLLLNQK